VVGLVRLALRRPYTFIVMALLIMIFGVASAFRTPIDMFPDINIPVVSVVFSYAGLPPDDMAGRFAEALNQGKAKPANSRQLQGGAPDVQPEDAA
jgi:multidrug efflux pump subunit AcrB